MTTNTITETEKDFAGNITLRCFAQIINPNRNPDIFGIGIQEEEAAAAGFSPNEDWQLAPDYFSAGSSIFVSASPRIVFVNISPLLITNPEDGEIKRFNKSTWQEYKTEGWKTLHVVAFFPVNRDNQLLSHKPFKIKLIGQSGRNLYDAICNKKDRKSYYNRLLAAYEQLSNQGVNEYFFTHGVIALNLVPKTIKLANDESVKILEVESFKVPNGSSKEIFLKTFIHGKSEASQQIKTAYELTKSWVDYKE